MCTLWFMSICSKVNRFLNPQHHCHHWILRIQNHHQLWHGGEGAQIVAKLNSHSIGVICSTWWTKTMEPLQAFFILVTNIFLFLTLDTKSHCKNYFTEPQFLDGKYMSIVRTWCKIQYLSYWIFTWVLFRGGAVTTIPMLTIFLFAVRKKISELLKQCNSCTVQFNSSALFPCLAH